MKIIEAMKRIKEIEQKRSDLQAKIATHSAYLSHETPVYPDQRSQVASWVQACRDLTAEEERLRIAIQHTNLVTPVTITLGGNNITKPIANWVLRRRLLANHDLATITRQGDRNLKEGVLQTSQGGTVEVKIVRCYDPVQRDDLADMFRSEPHIIDGALEVVNAVTDLMEA